MVAQTLTSQPLGIAPCAMAVLRWARCDYVRTLKCPLPRAGFAGVNGRAVDGVSGRYLAEAWLGSNIPASRPTDCLPIKYHTCYNCIAEFPAPPVELECGRDGSVRPW